MSTWGCPHELDAKCTRVKNLPCDPGMKGCVLFGRFVWSEESKNRPVKTVGQTMSVAPSQDKDVCGPS